MIAHVGTHLKKLSSLAGGTTTAMNRKTSSCGSTEDVVSFLHNYLIEKLDIAKVKCSKDCLVSIFDEVPVSKPSIKKEVKGVSAEGVEEITIKTTSAYCWDVPVGAFTEGQALLRQSLVNMEKTRADLGGKVILICCDPQANRWLTLNINKFKLQPNQIDMFRLIRSDHGPTKCYEYKNETSGGKRMKDLEGFKYFQKVDEYSVEPMITPFGDDWLIVSIHPLSKSVPVAQKQTRGGYERMMDMVVAEVIRLGWSSVECGTEA